jgi:hypothetical protein
MDLDYLDFIEKRENTKNDTLYIPKIRLNENQEKIMDIVQGFPVNKRMKYDQAKMIQAIQNGMIVLILYRGDKDSWRGGRERVIYPMVLGVNKNTNNELLRGWHFSGFSVSQKKETQKVWRLFKTKNILAMTFVGHFYRLPPKGYKMNDRIMTDKTVCKADFNTIRRNQEALIKAGKIEKQEDINIGVKESSIIVKIQVKNTGTILDLRKPFDNDILKTSKNYPKNIKMTILKSVFANEYIAICNALGEVNKTVKVFDQKTLMGTYKVIKAFTGDQLKNNRIINGKQEFDLFLFEKKL